ncbi:hypothetical protein SESBI_43070, partial [Sesbania bispinosa]
MAPTFTPISEIGNGNGNSHRMLRVRVIQSWKVPQFEKPNEFSSMEILLFDEK